MPAGVVGELGGDAAAGEVDVVLGGVERDAGELGAAEGDAAVAEVGEEVFAGVGAAGGLADDADDRVEVVERDLVAEQDVLALAGLVEEEGGAAADDVDAVIDEGVDGAWSSGSSLGWPLCTARKIMLKDSCMLVCL